MSSWIDQKYIKLVSHKLRNYKQKSEYLFNVSCPYCGDSLKNKIKARGYFYKKKDFMIFHCHNCNETKTVGNFLKDIDPELNREYNLEIYTEKKPKKDVFEHTLPIFSIDENLRQIKVIENTTSLDQLGFDHYANKYIRSRKIDPIWFPLIKFTPCFKSFVDQFLPGNGKNFPLAESRLLFPYYKSKTEILGLQGRSIFESELKYVTIKSNEDSLKIYGLDRINPNKRIYCVEGPIDSMFLDNGIASMDSKIDRVNLYLPADIPRTYIFDNEPRNPQIKRNLLSTIKAGHEVFIWPKYIQEKDINDWFKVINDKREIQSIIDRYTFSGLRAELEFGKWSK